MHLSLLCYLFRLVIIYSHFQLISLQKPIGLILRPKRDRSRIGNEWSHLDLSCETKKRPIRDQKETYLRLVIDIYTRHVYCVGIPYRVLQFNYQFTLARLTFIAHIVIF
jgi:hypothetical protein